MWVVVRRGGPLARRVLLQMSTAPNISDTPIWFQSTYFFGVDEKRRLQVPSKWRRENDETVYSLVPWPVASWRVGCILVLPPNVWNDLVKKLMAMSYGDPKTDVLRRLVGGGSDSAKIDKGGRIMLPEGMSKAADITDQGALVGQLDRFQIWSPKRLEEVNSSDAGLFAEAMRMI